jgi:hypothetical protein
MDVRMGWNEGPKRKRLSLTLTSASTDDAIANEEYLLSSASHDSSCRTRVQVHQKIWQEKGGRKEWDGLLGSW